MLNFVKGAGRAGKNITRVSTHQGKQEKSVHFLILTNVREIQLTFTWKCCYPIWRRKKKSKFLPEAHLIILFSYIILYHFVLVQLLTLVKKFACGGLFLKNFHNYILVHLFENFFLARQRIIFWFIIDRRSVAQSKF